MEHLTYVKNDFPDGWKETPFELLFKRLEENGFKTTNQGELSANEMVMDARPHSDLYKIEKDGRCFSFVLNATTNLRNGAELLDSIGGFKNISNKINKRVEFEIPPDRDVDGKCAAVEYWVRDLVNYFYGRPVEKRKFDTEKWDKIRREEYAELKAKSDARWNDYLKHPDKYSGPPPRIVEPQLYPNTIVGVIPISKPQGLAFALKFLDTEPLSKTLLRKGKK
jgi:hypothetical protein